MNNYSRLFHLTKDNKLKKAEKKPFELESKIKKIIHNNFSNIFASNLLLLTELSDNFGVREGNKKEPIGIIDDLVFNEREKTFYVFEYKKVRQSGVTIQAGFYRDLLRDNEKNRGNLKEKYNAYWIKRNIKKRLEYEDFKWQDMKIVCISPFFEKFQRSTDDKTFLVKITKFGNDIIRLESKDEWLFGKESDERKVEFKKKRDNEDKTTENEKGLEISEWREEIEKFAELVNQFFNNSVEIKNIWPRKNEYHISYKKKKRSILLVRVRQKELLIRLENNEVTKNLPSYHSRHYEKLNRKVEIKNKEDYQKVFKILKNYLEEFAKNY